MEDAQLDWMTIFAKEFGKTYFRDLQLYLADERKAGPVYPEREDVFNAFERTPFDKVKVVLIGQDPYHGEGEAHGLSFSVPAAVRKPPSLVNMLKELKHDLGCEIPASGDLTPWAERGVLLLNTTLTVRANQANSHKGRGWEPFTTAIVDVLNDREKPVVFLLWGSSAKKFAVRIDTERHGIVQGVHPSPLSAHRGFFGSRPFSAVNNELKKLGQEPIDWCLAPPAK
jgi:uracil-DNA glycosylase